MQYYVLVHEEIESIGGETKNWIVLLDTVDPLASFIRLLSIHMIYRRKFIDVKFCWNLIARVAHWG